MNGTLGRGLKAELSRGWRCRRRLQVEVPDSEREARQTDDLGHSGPGALPNAD